MEGEKIPGCILEDATEKSVTLRNNNRSTYLKIIGLIILCGAVLQIVLCFAASNNYDPDIPEEEIQFNTLMSIGLSAVAPMTISILMMAGINSSLRARKLTIDKQNKLIEITRRGTLEKITFSEIGRILFTWTSGHRQTTMHYLDIQKTDGGLKTLFRNPKLKPISIFEDFIHQHLDKNMHDSINFSLDEINLAEKMQKSENFVIKMGEGYSIICCGIVSLIVAVIAFVNTTGEQATIVTSFVFLIIGIIITVVGLLYLRDKTLEYDKAGKKFKFSYKSKILGINMEKNLDLEKFTKLIFLYRKYYVYGRKTYQLMADEQLIWVYEKNKIISFSKTKTFPNLARLKALFKTDYVPSSPQTSPEPKESARPLSIKGVCPNCGRKNKLDSKFCIGCGTKL
ncbi:MAG: zinc ribbon domain-containing protein [Candidatus Hodarchaeota archaeon]